MGIDKTHGRNYDLLRLLGAIDKGEVVLPEFQRSFLWDATAVKQLLATCLTGWPIGSLLLLPGRSRIFFKVREIQGAPPVREPFQLVVLDGQQRLTSLYQALYDTGDLKYAVQWRLISVDQPIEELEDAIISISLERWDRLYANPKAEYEAGLIPVSVLKRASDFYEWRDHAVSSADQSAKDLLTNLYVETLSGLDRYEVPAVLIDDDVHPEAVARIFERVNRLGQPLGTFDLMVAKSYTPGFNLREEWDRAREDRPKLNEFLKGDGLPVLSVISLQVRESLRQQDVLALTGAAVRDYWHRGVDALDQAITYAGRRLGVWQSDWMPYRAQLSILGTLAMNKKLEESSETVDRWFWSSIFKSRYDVASNTRSVDDYRLLSEGHSPLGGEIVLDRETLFSANKRQYGALHRGIICLLAENDPIDPLDERERVGQSGGNDVATVSFVPRDDRAVVGGHLLTLGLLLTARASSRTRDHVSLESLDGATLESQFLPPHTNFSNLNQLFGERLDRIADRLEELSGNPVRIVDTDTA